MGSMLAVVKRGAVTESTHTGSIVIVDAQGNLLYSYDNTEAKVFTRSSLKLVQTIPLLHSGITKGNVLAKAGAEGVYGMTP